MNLLNEELKVLTFHLLEIFEEFRNKKVFLTGGTGFFGTWLLESFFYANRELSLSTEILVLSRHPEVFLKKFPYFICPEFRFYRGDVQTFSFPQESFSYVIHAATAASAQLNRENPLEMFDTIVSGTRRVLEFARVCGAEKFLLTSSGAVYGEQASSLKAIPESYLGGPQVLNPYSVYGEAKRAAELLSVLYARFFEIKIARCFAFVGPYLPLNAHFAIGNFIQDGLAGRTISIAGDGTAVRSYLYASELIEWLLTLLVKGESCQAYHVGSEQGFSILEIAKKVREAFLVQFNSDLRIDIAQQSSHNKGAHYYVPSVKKAMNELNLKQRIELPEAIEKTIRYYQARKIL